MTAGVLQQACDCVLSVDIFAVRVNMWGTVVLATGELVLAMGVRMSFEANVWEAALEREERGIDVARATARIILWGFICQDTLL